MNAKAVAAGIACIVLATAAEPGAARETGSASLTFGEPVKASGKRFMQDGKEVILNGINYFPAYFPAIFPASWLGAGRYRPEIVEKDLGTLETLGVNLVSIQGPRAGASALPEECTNLRDFLRRAQSHGMLVNLYIGMGSLVPIVNPEGLATLPRDCALAGHPALFAYDIAWEPHFGRETRRSALQPGWLKWLEAGYGSVAGASAAFGGSHELPSDRELCDRAPSVKVATFRRFLDDMLSAYYRKARAAIHAVDDTHLIGVRSGYGGNGAAARCPDAPVDLRAGAKHLDFISPEAHALPKTDKPGLMARGGFTGAYADVGKPVFWAEFGVNADGSCPSCTESIQAGFFAGMFELMRRTSANGGAGWWFVGVRPQSPADTEHSDFGIIRDNGKSENLRPVARTFKGALTGVSAARRSYAINVVVDRDAAAADWVMYQSGSDAYAAATRDGQLVGVSTSCSGSTSQEAKFCVGNIPFNGSCLAKCLNSEWNSVQITDAAGSWKTLADGAKVAVAAGAPVLARLAAGNTGEGKWLAGSDAGGATGSVRFGCNENAGDIGCRRDIMSSVESFHDADSGSFVISGGVTSSARVVFQMLSEGVAWFGERLAVTLVPQKADRPPTPQPMK